MLLFSYACLLSLRDIQTQRRDKDAAPGGERARTLRECFDTGYKHKEETTAKVINSGQCSATMRQDKAEKRIKKARGKVVHVLD
jgi:hypothetical protein